MHLRIDRIPQQGRIEPPRADDIAWCVRLAQSPAVSWRAMENPLVRATRWYHDHKRDEPAAILSVVRAAPCECGCGIELVAHSVAAPDDAHLARGMAEAVIEYAMQCGLNGDGQDADRQDPDVPARPDNANGRHIRVMIQE